MHNNFTLSSPIYEAYSEESYEDEIESLVDNESLGENIDVQEGEFPVNSNPILESDLREELIKESTLRTDPNSHEPSPLPNVEVVSLTHKLPSTIFNHTSHST